MVFCIFWLGNFAPQRCALFLHRNFEKCSEREVLLPFSLANVLRATTECTFSTSQLPKVIRTWCALYILTSKCASRHNGVQFLISNLASWLRTRRFSEPTFRPSGLRSHKSLEKPVFRDFPTLSRSWASFFWLFLFSDLLSSTLLFSLTLPISAFHLSMLSEVWLLNFLRQLHYFTLQYTRLHYIIPRYSTQHYSTPQYTTLTTPHYNYNRNCNYTTLITLHYNYNFQLQLTTTTPLHYITTTPNNYKCTTPHYIQQLWWGDCNHCNYSRKHNSNHLAVHQWPSVSHNNQPFLQVSYFWNFRRRLVRYYWYLYNTTLLKMTAGKYRWHTMTWPCSLRPGSLALESLGMPFPDKVY